MTLNLNLHSKYKFDEYRDTEILPYNENLPLQLKIISSGNLHVHILLFLPIRQFQGYGDEPKNNNPMLPGMVLQKHKDPYMSNYELCLSEKKIEKKGCM